MIKQFLALTLAVTTALTSPASAYTLPDSSNGIDNPVKTKSPVKKLVIYGDADVILTSDESTEISVDENTVDLKKIKFVYYNGQVEIIIDEQHNATRPLIRIPAQQLQKLEVNGDGKIYSQSLIHSENLHILINGACEVYIRSTGKVVVKASEDYNLKVTKQQRRIDNAD